MARRKDRPDHASEAQARASLRGWWGFTCAMAAFLLGAVAFGYGFVTLTGWHDQLHHPERVGRHVEPIEAWGFLLFPVFAPCMAVAGLLLNCVIRTIPPLRALSERPAGIDPRLGFAAQQRGLARFALWSSPAIPLAIVAAWLAP